MVVTTRTQTAVAANTLTASEDIKAFTREADLPRMLEKTSEMRQINMQLRESDENLRQAIEELTKAKTDDQLLTEGIKLLIESKTLSLHPEGASPEQQKQVSDGILDNAIGSLGDEKSKVETEIKALRVDLEHLESAICSIEMGITPRGADTLARTGGNTGRRSSDEVAKNRREMTRIQLDSNSFSFPGDTGENTLLQADAMIWSIRTKADLMIQAAGCRRDNPDYIEYWRIIQDLDATRDEVQRYWMRTCARTDATAEYIMLMDQLLLDCIRSVLLKDLEAGKPGTYAKSAVVDHLESARLRSGNHGSAPNSAAETIHVLIKCYKRHKGEELSALMKKWHTEAPEIQSRREFKEAILGIQQLFPLVYGTGKGPNVESLFMKIARYWSRLEKYIDEDRSRIFVADDSLMRESLRDFFKVKVTISTTLSEPSDEPVRLKYVTEALLQLTGMAQSLQGYTTAYAHSKSATKKAAGIKKATPPMKENGKAKGVCWECGDPGHFKGSDACTKKAQNKVKDTRTRIQLDMSHLTDPEDISKTIDRLVERRKELRMNKDTRRTKIASRGEEKHNDHSGECSAGDGPPML